MSDGIHVINDVGRFAIIPVTLLTDSTMTANARLLYGILWSFSDVSNRESRPGRKTLAELLGASVDTVDRATRDLIDGGWLSVEATFDGARQTTNVYRLLSKGAAPMRRGGRTHAAHGGRTHAAQEQEPEEQEPPVAPQGATDETFNTIWEAWPEQNRGSRKKTLTAFRAAVKTHEGTIPELVTSVETHAAVYRGWPATERRFIPALSTWLDQERWESPSPEHRGADWERRRPTLIPPRDLPDPLTCDHKFIAGWCVWCALAETVVAS